MKLTSGLFLAIYWHPPVATASHDSVMFSFPRYLAVHCEGRTKGERTKGRLQIAACNILQAGGPQGLTIASICEEAGVSNGTFYIYFPDRNVLLDTLLTDFVTFLQLSMRAASDSGNRDAPRAATRAYLNLFEQNRGLMRCLVQPLEGFPEAQSAFQKLNREWIDVVVTSVERRQRREDGKEATPRAELLRRAYALGGMVDQYLSNLLLSKDPNLIKISQDREAVLETLSLIWERGMSR
jgi:AcrR family transcriptional regulator